MLAFRITLNDGTAFESTATGNTQDFMRKIQMAGYHDEASGTFYPPISIRRVDLYDQDELTTDETQRTDE